MNDPYRLLAESPDSLPVIADLFEELGRDDEARAFRDGEIHQFLESLGYSYSSGYSYGYGGYSYGYGYGYGGYSYGYGGYSYGYGGYSYGYGYGYGVEVMQLIKKEFLKMNEATIGSYYLIFVPVGLAYVGRFVRPAGLQGGVFEDCSNVHDTGNGACWADLARDAKGARARADFRKFDGRKIFPCITDCTEWKGELPR